MMRSMYSGVSGLRVHQTKMDVIGNNIANVNTVGFKASRVTFSDVFSQTTQSATGANEDTGRGGVNAMQIGLGTTVSSIYTDPTSEGASQRTDNPYDMQISGQNFFIVNDGSVNYFTKVGAFTTDAQGYLVTQSGMHVMGWQVDPTDTQEIRKDLVSKLGITTAENNYSAPEATKACYFSGNIDKTNSDVTGSGLVTTMTIYDKQGYAYTVKYNIKQDEAETNKYNVTVTDVLDSKNKSILSANGGNYDVTMDGSDSFTIEYDAETGDFKQVGAGDGQKSIKLLFASTGANAFYTDDGGIDVDFSTTTQYAASGKTTIAPTRGNLDGNGAGRKAGTMSSVSIGNDGKIVGNYDNGDKRLLGQIAVTSFANAAGLEKVGDSLYQETQNSGYFDGVGQDPTANGGKVTQGVLEMSNVDLSAEFTEMITTQRGFQANSRIITTSDTLLEELVNLKR